jgi:hypothetical protein
LPPLSAVLPGREDGLRHRDRGQQEGEAARVGRRPEGRDRDSGQPDPNLRVDLALRRLHLPPGVDSTKLVI